VLATLNSMYRLRINKVHRFRPKIEVYNRIGNFVCKTVSNRDELRPALALRFQVLQPRENTTFATSGLDVDSHDAQCDHLVILDTRQNRVAGTFRLGCSLFADQYQASEQFLLTRILQKPGIKVEMGRACIHPDYHRGFVISMLWRGIAEYMISAQADWLFGTVGVPTLNPRTAALIYREFLDQKRMHSDFFAPPTLAHTLPNLNFWLPRFAAPLSPNESAEAQSFLSPLWRSFLERGVSIGGEPALAQFGPGIEFFTILNRENCLRRESRFTPESVPTVFF